MNQDPEALKKYDSVIKEQLKNGIVEVVEKPADGEVGKTHNLPHHAVIRRDKATTKLRVVYDALARSNGTALTDFLYTGPPPFPENIFDILLRFRASRIALTGDVEKAFFMVGITEETSGTEQKVLGVRWNFVSDQFVLDLKEIATLARNIEPTKGNVVSVTAKFYDPMGFLSPIITEYKILSQGLCKAKIGWDEPLEGGLKNEWLKLATGLYCVSSFTVSRCYFQEVTEKIVDLRCIKQSLCSSDIPTCHNNHAKLCQILNLAIQSCSSETRDNPEIRTSCCLNISETDKPHWTSLRA